MLTYEDFPLGKSFLLGPVEMESEKMIAFAKKFDAQPFHTDPDSPEATAMGGLIASGWYTSSLLMRLMCDSYLLNTASQGSGGLDAIRWLKPVFAGDVLTGTSTVVSRRISNSNPKLGLVGFAYELRNQKDEKVTSVTGMGMVDVAVVREQKND